MSDLILRVQFDDGRIFEGNPTSFEPLKAYHLQSLLLNPSLPIELAFTAIDVQIDGVKIEGTGRATTHITFLHPPQPYALVPKGWLPMPFAVPQHFLVDKNVVSILKKIRQNTSLTQ